MTEETFEPSPPVKTSVPPGSGQLGRATVEPVRSTMFDGLPQDVLALAAAGDSRAAFLAWFDSIAADEPDLWLALLLKLKGEIDSPHFRSLWVKAGARVDA